MSEILVKYNTVSLAASRSPNKYDIIGFCLLVIVMNMSLASSSTILYPMHLCKL